MTHEDVHDALRLGDGVGARIVQPEDGLATLKLWQPGAPPACGKLPAVVRALYVQRAGILVHRDAPVAERCEPMRAFILQAGDAATLISP